MSDERRSAVLQVPGSGAQDSKRRIPCEVQGMQGKRLNLSTQEYIAESTVVSIEFEDTLLLGEVVTCSSVQDAWSAVIHIEQMLTGLQSLMALRAHLLSESGESVSAALPELVPVGTRN